MGDFDHMVERESAVLTDITTPPQQPQELASSTTTQTFNKILTVAHGAVTSGAGTGSSVRNGLTQLAARHQRPIATTVAQTDRAIMQQIETLPDAPA
jgi:hypothetical protein